MTRNKDNFSRNLGWLTEQEQEKIHNIRVAIAGCGGVGGEHIVALSRLGIEKFNISDLDTFDNANMNRQALCFTSTIGEEKVKVAEKTIKDINPNAQVHTWPNGINTDNIPEFLDNIDIYVDSIDVFAIDMRIALFRECERRGIPIISAGPLGMGTSLICFNQDSMSIDKYFNFKESDSRNTSIIKFLVGLSPTLSHASYIADHSYINIGEHKTPSLIPGVKAAGAAISTTVVKLALGRGELILAPASIQIDFYKNTISKPRPFWGNRGILQRAKIKHVTSKFSEEIKRQ